MLSYRLQLVGGVGRGSWADKTTTSPPFVCVTVKRKAVFPFFLKIPAVQPKQQWEGRK